jgi:hypothetical protein
MKNERKSINQRKKENVKEEGKGQKKEDLQYRSKHRNVAVASC